MKYVPQFIDEIKKEVDTPTVKLFVGVKRSFYIALIILEKEWNLRDDEVVLNAIKKMNVKIHTFVHFFNGSQFPKLSEINQKDLPLEIYNDSNSIMVGVKRSDLFLTQAARDVNSTNVNLFYPRDIKEAVALVDSLTK